MINQFSLRITDATVALDEEEAIFNNFHIFTFLHFLIYDFLDALREVDVRSDGEVCIGVSAHVICAIAHKIIYKNDFFILRLQFCAAKLLLFFELYKYF